MFGPNWRSGARSRSGERSGSCRGGRWSKSNAALSSDASRMCGGLGFHQAQHQRDARVGLWVAIIILPGEEVTLAISLTE